MGALNGCCACELEARSEALKTARQQLLVADAANRKLLEEAQAARDRADSEAEVSMKLQKRIEAAEARVRELEAAGSREYLGRRAAEKRVQELTAELADARTHYGVGPGRRYQIDEAAEAEGGSDAAE